MNGVVEIQAGESKHTLRFSVHGCGAFQQRLFANPDKEPAKILTDMVYSGLYGEAMRNGQMAPEYSLAYDIVDIISGQEDFDKQSNAIWDTYNESVHGRDFAKKLDLLSKKKVTKK